MPDGHDQWMDDPYENPPKTDVCQVCHCPVHPDNVVKCIICDKEPVCSDCRHECENCEQLGCESCMKKSPEYGWMCDGVCETEYEQKKVWIINQKQFKGEKK